MQELEGLLSRARQDPDVLAVILFGSAARGEPHRDLDVALVQATGSSEHPFDLRLRYADDERIDVQVFQDVPLFIRMRVLRDGRVLFVRDEDALYEVALAAVRAWQDFRPFCEEYLEGAGLA